MHESDAEQIARVNTSGRVPVVFIHGLWLLPSSWDRWGPVFADAGYAPFCPGWPDDPDTVAEAYAEPEVFANKTVGQVANHYAAIIAGLDRKPVVIGHSFGGLLTQILAGRGLAAVSVAIDSAPFRGVLPLPISALRSAAAVLGNPANRHRATLRDVRRADSRRPDLPGRDANLNPWTEAKVNSTNPARGPMLVISGEKDHTVPPAISDAIYKKQMRNHAVTELADRGHSLTIDHGWREVADVSLAFVKRFA